MVELAHADSLQELLAQAAEPPNALFRGQSRPYFRGESKDVETVTPSLFRLPKPLDLKPLMRAADMLFLRAHGVYHEMERIRDSDKLPEYRASDFREPYKQGLVDRVIDWLIGRIFPKPDDDDEPDPDSEAFPFANPSIGHGFGSRESFSPFFQQFYMRELDERLGMAMLQHYGAPSGTLDVSFDPLIALWFACHKYNRHDDGQVSYSRNQGPGVVYLMNVPDTHLIDIRGGEIIAFETQERSLNAPIAGLRGRRQKGGLIFGATIDDPEFFKFVVKKIIVTPSVFDQTDERLKPLTQQYLFPGPDEDEFYRELLKAQESSDSATRQLASFIPLYRAP